MLSRYTAFVIGDLDHIENSHACDKREGLDRPDVKNMFGAVEWDGLEIFRTSVGLKGDEAGTVYFSASFRRNGKILVHRENSNFRRVKGRWIYVDGTPTATAASAGKIGCNQPCPCGSGKKYK